MRYETVRPVDLAALLILALSASVAVFVLPEGHPARVALALLFLLVAPGYALVAALFPERGRVYGVAKGEEAERVEEASEGLDALERVALSLGLSVAIVPLLGLALNYTPWGIRLVPIVVTVAAFILVCAPVAYVRRRRLQPGARLAFVLDLDTGAWRRMRGADRALAIVLALAVVGAAASVVYVLATPRPQERFTEFYVLGPGGKAAAYPSALAPGAQGRLIVGIVDHEGRATLYAWEAVMVAGAFNGTDENRTFVPAGETVIDQQSVRLEDGATSETNWTFAAPSAPGDYRLELRLTKDDRSEVYRQLHLWLSVA